jgi:hypothetical protein
LPSTSSATHLKILRIVLSQKSNQRVKRAEGRVEKGFGLLRIQTLNCSKKEIMMTVIKSIY